MSDYDYNAKVTGRLKVIPLPALKQAWLLFHDGEILRAEVAAIGMAYSARTIHGDADKIVEGVADDDVSPEYVLGLGTSKMFFLALPADAGNWESLWVEQEMVFFSEEAAKATAKRRQKDKMGVVTP